MIALILGVFLVPSGLIALWSGYSDWKEQNDFLKKSLETNGTITGLIGAQYSYKTMGSDGGVGAMGVQAVQMATGQSTGKEGTYAGGAFLRVEYEVGDYIYTIRSKQNFDEIPETGEVKVQYNPANPKDAIVEGYHSGNEKNFQMIGGSIAVAIPFLYHLFFG